MKSFSKLFVFTCLLIPIFGFSQAGFITNTDKTCKMYTSTNVEKRSFSLVSGTCSGGYVSGQASVKVYQDGNWFSTYTGPFMRGMLNGEGTVTFYDGEIFSGKFVDGIYVEGKYSFSDGRVYEGPFNSMGNQEGIGSLYYASVGHTYQGPFVNGKPYGKGVLYMQNGNRIEATFDGYKPQGWPKMYFPNGDRYDGDLEPSGASFSGTYGRLFLANGSNKGGKLIDGVFYEDAPYVPSMEDYADPVPPPPPAQRSVSEVMVDLANYAEKSNVYEIINIAYQYKSTATDVKVTKGGNTLVYTITFVHAATGNRYLHRFILDLTRVEFVIPYPGENMVLIGVNGDECVEVYEDNMTLGYKNKFVANRQSLTVYTLNDEEQAVADILCELMKPYNASVSCLKK